MSKYIDITGQKFGEWTVIGRSDKPQYVKCQCSCGTIKDVHKPSLLSGKTTSCKNCANKRMGPHRSQVFLQKQKDKYIDQVVNGWKIIDVYKNEKTKDNDLFCVAICPVCGRETQMRLTNVRKVAKCMRCTNNIKEASDIIRQETNIDGTSLISLKSRTKGTLNKNSTTGHNGICVSKYGYRTSITFKRKTIYLGTYKNIDDAIIARKNAEELIYKSYLAEHEGWEQELKEKLSALKKK